MKFLIGFFALVVNHLFEIYRFVKYSNYFSFNSSDKLQGKITFYYHSIEKGLINKPLRLRFGADKIIKLKYFLNLWINRGYSNSESQFLSACTVLKKYYMLHADQKIEIHDIISKEEFIVFSKYCDIKDGGIIHLNGIDYFNEYNSPFSNFSNSRHSVRHFNGKLIDNEIILEVIKIARNAPSVCNRQGFRVKFVNNESLVRQALQIQNGLNATASTVKQLFIVTVDRSIFVSPAEWFQVYIDGGIFLQNILYALHYHQIAAVPLNWSKHFTEDLKMEKLLKLNPQEKIIALIAIGYPCADINVPRSVRRDVSEILEIIK